MPHYHFHMLNGRPFRDLDGEDLADEAAARRMTLTIMGEVLRDGEIDVRGAVRSAFSARTQPGLSSPG